MPENRSRFVLLCQQSLAFGLVAAMAAPAATLVNLEIVRPVRPGTAGAAQQPGGTGALSRGVGNGVGGGAAPSLVASRPVDPRITNVSLDRISKRGLDALSAPGALGEPGADGPAASLASADAGQQTGDLAVLSSPQPVDGLGTVGVTWDEDVNLPDDAITVSVRTKQDGVWSSWQRLPYHEEEGPDPDSAEAASARPGTDPVYIGGVDDVQIKAVTDSGEAPEDMRLAVVDPGTETAPEVEKPAIDTGELELSAGETGGTASSTTGDPSTTGGTDTTGGSDGTDVTDGSDVAASLSAGTVHTAKPKIFSRAQWGANERMRDKSSLHYGEVHAGFVHHTVNANGYSRAQVPSIIRGIYAYHTQSRGWSDVGYNFLVDRFGRIWEGRYGGVDRPVVGAHTLGYNDDAFAMSAIGNFETTRPSSAILDAYGRLFAWKLSLHGVRANATRQWVTKRHLPAINGHRDVGQTACPGKYLYAKIPTIRSLATKYQKSFSGRQRMTDIAGSRFPDLVVRNKTTKRAYLVRTGGGHVTFSTARTVSSGWGGRDLITSVLDVTGDRKDDLLARDASTGTTHVYPGDGAGHFGAPVRPTRLFRLMDNLTGVGDWNGDGHNDVVGHNGHSHRLYVFFGDGHGRLGTHYRILSTHWSGYTATVGAGDWNGDGKPDLLARTSTGRLLLVPGTGSRLGSPKLVSAGWSGFDVLSGLSDLTNDGTPDLIGRNRRTKAVYIYPGNGHGRYAGRLGPFGHLAGPAFLIGAGQVVGSPADDVVARDSAGRLLRYTNSGAAPVEAITSTGRRMASADAVLNVGDWNSDGHGDVVTRSHATGSLYLYRGNGRGGLRLPVRIGRGFGPVRQLAAVGDVTGDGHPDLMGAPSGHAMRIYPGNGATWFKHSYVAHSAVAGTEQLGAGLWNGDGSPDSLLRHGDGKLVLYPGNGPGGLTGGRTIATVSKRYDWLVGLGDVDGNGHPDLVARESSTGKLWLLPGNASGLGSRRLLTTGMGRFDLAG